MNSEPTLQILAKECMTTNGLDYPHAYRKLRGYVHSITEEEFEEQIKRVTEIDVFRYLMAAGLSIERMELVSAKIQELRA